MSGFFVTDNIDTVQCFIRYRNWVMSPAKIKYRLTPTGKVQTFTTEGVHSFGIGKGIYYLKIKGDFPFTQRLYNQKTIDKQPVIKEREVFVKKIIEGDARLYMYKSVTDEVFLVSNENRPENPQILYYKQFIPGGSNDIMETDLFRRNLYRLLPCIRDVSLQDVTYSLRALADYVIEYNICIGSGVAEMKDIAGRELGKF